MTLKDAEKIATDASGQETKAKLTGEDDTGISFYMLNVWDESQEDEEIQKQYSLRVKGGVIFSFDVDVKHYPRPQVKLPKNLHRYDVMGKTSSGRTVTATIQAESVDDAIAKYKAKGYSHVTAKLSKTAKK